MARAVKEQERTCFIIGRILALPRRMPFDILCEWYVWDHKLERIVLDWNRSYEYVRHLRNPALAGLGWPYPESSTQ